MASNKTIHGSDPLIGEFHLMSAVLKRLLIKVKRGGNIPIFNDRLCTKGPNSRWSENTLIMSADVLKVILFF